MSQIERTVLIVEDNLEDIEMYRRYLLRDQKYKYNIVTAKSGKQGLALWQCHQPDVILLDYRLPDLDGLEFLVALQTQAKQQIFPVIMVTGQGNEALAVQAIKAGAQDYLIKGQITPESLRLTLNRTIDAWELHKQLQQRIEREQVISRITQKVYRTLNLDEILQIIIEEVRQFLQTDRVIVFRLEPDGKGAVMAESVDAQWRSILSTSIHDPCLVDSYVKRYHQGQVIARANINDVTIDPCHVKLLTQYQVKANLVAPIIHEDQFWGLLIAHHCAKERQWQPFEIELLQQLSTQVSLAIRQAELHQRVTHELAENKRTSEMLRQSEEFKQRVLESSSDCIKVLDLDARLLYMNAGGMCLMEIDDITPYLNMKWCCFWQEEIQKEVEASLIAAKAGEQGRFQGFCATAKGAPKWWDVVITPIRDGVGQIVQLLSISRDITERKQTEIERERILQLKQAALAESERVNRIKDEFLAVLSHELRSPLNPILGWVKILQKGKLDQGRTTQALATIERNVKLQTQLIDDLLDMARILRGKLSLNVSTVNLLFAIESSIETVQTAATAKSISINTVLSNIGQVSGDTVRIQQIVWNLLSNAVKFTPNGGEVEIRLEQVDNQAQITVTDTGIGISSDFLPHIFESFRQEDASICRKYGGLGLGLAIVYQLVEAHGGTITANSLGTGKGATFTVRFPLLNIKLGENQSNKLLPQLELTGIRVLAIDDEKDNCELISFLLGDAGAKVITAVSAAEFLEAIGSFQPDVLISDIGMPEVDGYTLLSRVRSSPFELGCQVPAIALTAYAGELDQQKALAVGFQMHLSKPVEPNQLVTAVANLLKK